MTRPDETAFANTDADFDVREFARTVHGSHRSELDLETLAQTRLPADVARLVRVLRDLEHTTMQRMRNLLVTATHKDARVTAFLTSWAFEKFWIADALDVILNTTQGERVEDPDPATRHALSERAERRGPVRRAISANFAGPQIVAAHVTVGLVDELLTQIAYRRLGEAATALGSIASSILELKDRHVRFLRQETTRRLAVSTKAQRLTSKAITQAVWPVGAIELPASDRVFLTDFVYATPAGRAEIDTIVDFLATLPGIGAGAASSVSARLVP